MSCNLQGLSLLLLLLLLSIKENDNLKISSHGIFTWAPFTTTKKPFITFINDFNVPRWYTRHYMTKKINRRQVINLIQGIPFSILCGACFQKSSLKAELTLHTSNIEHLSIPLINKEENSTYFEIGVNQCLITYMITVNHNYKNTTTDDNNKIISCTLTRKRQVITHELKFTIIQQTLPTIVKKFVNESQLQQPNDNNFLLYCGDDDDEDDEKNSIITVGYKTTVYNPIINRGSYLLFSYSKQNEEEITCFNYNFLNNENGVNIHHTLFVITNNNNMNNRHSRSSTIFNNNNNNNNKRVSIVLFIIAICVISLLLCIVFLYYTGLYDIIKEKKKEMFY